MGASNTPVLLRLIINERETYLLENALAIATDYAIEKSDEADKIGDHESAKVYRFTADCYNQLMLTLDRKLEKVANHDDN